MRETKEALKGEIVRFLPEAITLKLPEAETAKAARRGYTHAFVQFTGGRPVTEKQRRMCWKLISEIAGWAGQRGKAGRELVNEELKIDFLLNRMRQNALTLFSLKDAPLGLVGAYQDYLLHFILTNNVPCGMPLYQFAHNHAEYARYCLLNRKCVICGEPAGLHKLCIGKDGGKAAALCASDEVMAAALCGEAGMTEVALCGEAGMTEAALCAEDGVMAAALCGEAGVMAAALCAEHGAVLQRVGTQAFLEAWNIPLAEADAAVCKVYRERGD